MTGDYNGDGKVDAFDLNFVLVYWGDEMTDPPDGWVAPWDGKADAFELNDVLVNWGNEYVSEEPMEEAPIVQEALCTAVEACAPSEPVQETQATEESKNLVPPVNNESLAVESVDIPQAEMPVVENPATTPETGTSDYYEDPDTLVPAVPDTGTTDKTGLIDTLEPQLVIEV
jgi:hypothetical protein